VPNVYVPKTKKRSKPVSRLAPLLFMELRLSLHIDDSLQHLVTYGDDLGVGLEAALGDDHVGELGDDVYVRLLLL
jgi:hypothetical protein